MLDIVSNFDCMQFQGKLIYQTWENDKKPSFGSDFAPLAQILAVNFVFQKSGSVSH